MRKLFVLDEGVEIPSVPASASSKSRGLYPLVRVGTIEGNTVVSSVSRKENPVWGAVEPHGFEKGRQSGRLYLRSPTRR